MSPSAQSQSIRLSITRLRRGAILCCWIVGLALLAQTVIWSLASYTQIRHASEDPVATVTEQVVVDDAPAPKQDGRILPPPPQDTRTDEATAPPDDPSSTFSRADRVLGASFDLAGGIGRLALIVLISVIAVGIALGTSAAVPGADRAVLAFVWAVILGTLVLPLGTLLHLPWEQGALSTYEHMTSWVEQIELARAGSLENEVEDVAAPSTLLMHARFLLLPLACIVAVAMVGLRFCLAIESAVLKRESMRLDPALEREASNISPTSLHGTRGTGVINRTIAAEPEPEPVASIQSNDADAPPKRLI